MSNDEPTSAEGKILSFTDHLEELRVRIIICLVFFIISFAAAFYFAPHVVSFLMQPLLSLPRDQQHGVLTLHLKQGGEVDRWTISTPNDDSSTFVVSQKPAPADVVANVARDSLRVFIEGAPYPVQIGAKAKAHLTYLTPLEPFFLWIQGALLLSSVLTIPMIVYQFWLFISPGLLRSERGIVKPLLTASILLFPMGAGFAYTIFKVVLRALLSFGDSIPFLEPNLVASSYVKFLLVMMFAFGVVFEFPLVLVLLSRMGIVNSEKLTKQRRIAIVVMAVIAAVATPSPDPFSMLLMLFPLLVLYEGSIYAIKLLERRDRARTARETVI